MKAANKLYWMLLILSAAGYAWIGFNLFYASYGAHDIAVCLFKNATGLPCPSCGTTRALLYLLNGELLQSLSINPLGVLAAAVLIIVPPWVAADTLASRKSLAAALVWTERQIKTRRAISVPLAVLVLSNWGWNIIKGI